MLKVGKKIHGRNLLLNIVMLEEMILKFRTAQIDNLDVLLLF